LINLLPGIIEFHLGLWLFTSTRLLLSIDLALTGVYRTKAILICSEKLSMYMSKNTEINPNYSLYCALWWGHIQSTVIIPCIVHYDEATFSLLNASAELIIAKCTGSII